MRKLTTLAALLLLTGTAIAKAPPFDYTALSRTGCVDVPGVGCRLNGGSSNRVVVYHRGFWIWEPSAVPARVRNASRVTVPAQYLPDSARGALLRYGLDRVAHARHSDVIVTGGSPVALVGAELNELNKPKVALVAHSGGYQGLVRTMQNMGGRKIDEIILLDCFYGVNSGANAYIARYLRDHPETKCSGFYTEHNKWRYNNTFLPVAGRGRCDIKEGAGHNDNLDGRIIAGLDPFLAEPERRTQTIVTELDLFSLPRAGTAVWDTRTTVR